MSDRINIHGTGLCIGPFGLLVRGPSGSGKSMLTLELMHDAQLRGVTAKLVADDRLELTVENKALFMHAPASIGGLIELRGRGIVTRPFVEKAQVHLVVDTNAELTRLIEDDELTTELEGVTLARCPVPSHDRVEITQQKLLVLEALRALEAGAA